MDKNALDELFGEDRNEIPSQQNNKSKVIDWKEKSICKHFLVGFCPYELLHSTKAYYEACELKHSEEIKQVFLSDRQNVVYIGEWEQDLMAVLEELVISIDHKIKKAMQRKEQFNTETFELTPQMQSTFKKIDDDTLSLMDEIEAHNKAVKPCECREAFITLDRLKQAKTTMETASLDPLLAKEAQMKVCEVCGAMQNLHNVEKRSTSHVEGKQHKAQEKIREWLVRLRARLERRKNTDYDALIQREKDKISSRREQHKDDYDHKRKRHSQDKDQNTTTIEKSEQIKQTVKLEDKKEIKHSAEINQKQTSNNKNYDAQSTRNIFTHKINNANYERNNQQQINSTINSFENKNNNSKAVENPNITQVKNNNFSMKANLSNSKNKETPWEAALNGSSNNEPKRHIYKNRIQERKEYKSPWETVIEEMTTSTFEQRKNDSEEKLSPWITNDNSKNQSKNRERFFSERKHKNKQSLNKNNSEFKNNFKKTEQSGWDSAIKSLNQQEFIDKINNNSTSKSDNKKSNFFDNVIEKKDNNFQKRNIFKKNNFQSQFDLKTN